MIITYSYLLNPKETFESESNSIILGRPSPRQPVDLDPG